MIFPFASCLPTERKMEGAYAKLLLSVAITNTTLLMFFSSVHYFSRECFFFFRMSDLAKLFCHWSKHICLYNIMNINFLRSCMLCRYIKVLFNKYRKKWSMQGVRWMRRKSVLFLIQGASELGLWKKTAWIQSVILTLILFCFFLRFLVQFSSVQSLSRVWLFVTPWTAVRQASLSITNSQSLLKLMSIELVMPSNHLILCHLLLPPSVIPNIRVFSNESVLRIRWPKD